MTAAQLEAELEAALEAMTEEEYDPAVIDAYLDALDRKAPTPDHPDAGPPTPGFQARVQRAAGQVSAAARLPAEQGPPAHPAPGRRGGGPADHISVQLHGRGPGVRRGRVRRHRPLDGQCVQLRRSARGGRVRPRPDRRPGGTEQSNRQEGCPGGISNRTAGAGAARLAAVLIQRSRRTLQQRTRFVYRSTYKLYQLLARDILG